MTKSLLYFTINATLFLIAFIVFWMELTVLYDDPLVLISFEPSSLVPILYLAGTLAFIAIPAALLLTVDFDKRFRIGMYVAAALSSILLFIKTPLIVLILTLGTIGALLLFDRESSKELQNQRELKPHRVFRRSISHFITLMAIVISAGYYSTTAEQISDYRFTLPDQVFNQLIEKFTTEAEANPEKREELEDTITKQTFESQVRPQILNQLSEAGITDPTTIQRQLAKAQSIFEDKAKEQLSQITAPTKNKAESSFVSSVKTQVENNINSLVTKNTRLLTALFSFSLFALMQFLDPIVSLIVTGILYALTALLRQIGVLKVETTTLSVERLTV